MTQSLKSIQAYLDRKQARRDTVRAASRRWSIMLMTGNAAGMITIVSFLADPDRLDLLQDFHRISLATATLAFGIALLPSIMGAVALGMPPTDKALKDGPRSDFKELRRNLMIGGIGFIIGLACAIGAICGLALSVMLETTSKTL